MNNFYKNLQPIHNINEATNTQQYHPIPSDWLIGLTDVKNSTHAIESGQYKNVNTLAAASIAGVVNAMPDVDVPFVFGGDGATLLFPPEKRDVAEQALRGTQDLARDFFDLELRIAVIPVQVVLDAGYQILVAKLWMSADFQQALFSGGGLAYADTLLKSDNRTFTIEATVPAKADFTGFECRWNEIPSRHQENISLIVKAAPPDEQLTYKAVLKQIDEIYGDSDERHPIIADNLQLALNPQALDVEARVRHKTTHWRQLLKMWQGSMKAGFAMIFKIGRWGTYKQHLIDATDHEKFGDALYMTISGTPAQRNALKTYLEQKTQTGQLVYGIHVSTHAVVTCIVYDYFGRQMHFVDTTHGGYAFAAKQLKQKVQIMKPIQAMSS